jgi:hypothetical protein
VDPTDATSFRSAVDYLLCNAVNCRIELYIAQIASVGNFGISS